MKKTIMKGLYSIDGDNVGFALDAYIFKDGALTYSYCPALDITAYGKNSEEAKEEMEYQLQEYFDYTIKEHTLDNDLAEHGWHKENANAYVAPSLSYLMRRYPDFKDLLENREYYKYNQPLHIARTYEYAGT